ncbi:SDR family NAD(P)-dependent oxidoreductase [Flexibacterium corallicola]|uniref:SDR family NAD(P)-dependent oxidoreductase n=1 Tax=Flexibacterium corallicola TaxID=3037259 RepID=UPI00286F1924|nr:SDR family NAD(P)-dependent oxidoreductase [Pseudovibrio sp. M1P-2-3]
MYEQFRKKYGEWALVTGATSGIGAELAHQLAQRGLNLVLVARREDVLKENAEKLAHKYGVKAEYIAADLASAQGIEAVTATDKDIGLLVHAAGIETNGAFGKIDLEVQERMIRLNVLSTMQLAHHFARPMISRGRGGILLLASIVAHMPSPYFSNYAGTKSYVLNFGASLYGELKPKGVDVCILSPGMTETAMTEDNGVDWDKLPVSSMKPDVVAKAGLDSLGKKLSVVAGFRNQMTVGSAKFSPLSVAACLGGAVMKRAIRKDKLWE